MLRSLCIAVILLASGMAFADTVQEEIDHLITYLSDSGCTYIRNGMEYTALEAVEHINRKYDYFHDDIDSAETFVELSASKSTMSGKPYSIKCPGKVEQSSASWLLEELGRYRQSRGGRSRGGRPRGQ